MVSTKHQACKLKHKSKHLDLQQNVRCANEYEHKVQRYIHNDNDQFSMNSTNDFHSTLSIYASLRACACASSWACASSS